MLRKNFAFAILLQWLGVLLVIFINQGMTLQVVSPTDVTPSTPVPFLGPIYYGRWDVLNVFDHQLPWAGITDDGNDFVLHYDGSQHLPATPQISPTNTPLTPIPGTPPPTSTPAIIPGGYGYDEHGGIDYDLNYVPVLAAADGEVTVAGWNNPANHRSGYGLYVTINHGDYRTIYGHLSALTVQVGDEVTPSPEKSVGIIGISGNTGGVLGGCSGVEDDPLCAAHLHFEVRKPSGYSPVNPYGWVSQTVNDPWATAAVSYPIWITPPALIANADQYPGAGSQPVPQPPPLLPVLTIHNEDGAYSEVGDCWTDQGSGGDLFGVWRGALAREISEPYCAATWSVEPNGVTSAGEYDVYAYIPQTSSPITLTRGAEYTIYADGGSEVHKAIGVQAVYAHPDNEHGPWVYLGRYYFQMTGVGEAVELTNVTFRAGESDSGWGDEEVFVVAADGIRLVRSDGPTVYVSLSGSGSIGGVGFEDEDIVAYQPSNQQWEMIFDGSDVGLGGGTVDVDGFEWLNGEDLLLSLNQTVTINGVGSVSPQDVLRFHPSSLGGNTAGTFELYFDGSDVGLGSSSENVDGIGLTGDGDLVLSTTGNFSVPGLVGADEDLLLFEATSLGQSTSGSWELYLDGSDVGLDTSNENIDGVWIEPVKGEVLLSTIGTFGVAGSAGGEEDVFGCYPQSLGDESGCTFEGLFWDGSRYGLGVNVDDLSLVGSGVTGCSGVANCSFELLTAGGQFVGWTEVEMPPFAVWQPSNVAHSGNYSAEGLAINNNGEPAMLYSEVMGVEAGKEYAVSYFVRPDDDNKIVLELYLRWDGFSVTYLAPTRLLLSEWQLRGGDFICPPPGASTLQLEFILYTNNEPTPNSIFLDDVRVESRPGNCPQS